MAGVLETNRRRIALALTLCGVGLIVCGAILILYHQYNLTIIGQPYAVDTKARNLPLAKAIRDVLGMLLLIVVIFAFGSLAMIRWSRRFRSYLLRKPQPPTPAQDVWTMHQLPTKDEQKDTSTNEE